MAYRRKFNYHFLTEKEVGIYNVPIGRMIIVENFDDKVRCFLKINNNLSEDSTILDAIISGALAEIALKIGNEVEINTLHVKETLRVGEGIHIKIKGE